MRHWKTPPDHHLNCTIQITLICVHAGQNTGIRTIRNSNDHSNCGLCSHVKTHLDIYNSFTLQMRTSGPWFAKHNSWNLILICTPDAEISIKLAYIHTNNIFNKISFFMWKLSLPNRIHFYYGTVSNRTIKSRQFVTGKAVLLTLLKESPKHVKVSSHFSAPSPLSEEFNFPNVLKPSRHAVSFSFLPFSELGAITLITLNRGKFIGTPMVDLTCCFNQKCMCTFQALHWYRL